jgi:hypothetical protein
MAEEPNPPTWPSTVSVFDPSMSNEDISAIVEAAYAINGGDPRTTTCGNGEVTTQLFSCHAYMSKVNLLCDLIGRLDILLTAIQCIWYLYYILL